MIGTFLADERGATAIEYSMIAALVGLACILALERLGTSLAETFGRVASALELALH